MCISRNNVQAESHYRLGLLRKYFVSWELWIKKEQERRDMEKAQEKTKGKMQALLEAASSGKLWQGEETPSEVGKGSKRNTKDDIVCIVIIFVAFVHSFIGLFFTKLGHQWLCVLGQSTLLCLVQADRSMRQCAWPLMDSMSFFHLYT